MLFSLHCDISTQIIKWMPNFYTRQFQYEWNWLDFAFGSWMGEWIRKSTLLLVKVIKTVENERCSSKINQEIGKDIWWCWETYIVSWHVDEKTYTPAAQSINVLIWKCVLKNVCTALCQLAIELLTSSFRLLFLLRLFWL